MARKYGNINEGIIQTYTFEAGITMSELRSKIRSIFFNECPSCGKGSVFISNNPYDLRKFSSMHKACPECGHDYRQEPGFYFGATYVSYLVQVITVLLIYLIFYIGFDWGIWPFASLSAGVLLLSLPLNFRYSRRIWLALFGVKRKKSKN